jgi:hypothetical protein
MPGTSNLPRAWYHYLNRLWIWESDGANVARSIRDLAVIQPRLLTALVLTRTRHLQFKWISFDDCPPDYDAVLLPLDRSDISFAFSWRTVTVRFVLPSLVEQLWWMVIIPNSGTMRCMLSSWLQSCLQSTPTLLFFEMNPYLIRQNLDSIREPVGWIFEWIETTRMHMYHFFFFDNSKDIY